MHSRQLKLLLAVLFAVCALPVHAQTVEHESIGHDSATSQESTHQSHKNVVSFFRERLTQGGASTARHSELPTNDF